MLLVIPFNNQIFGEAKGMIFFKHYTFVPK